MEPRLGPRLAWGTPRENANLTAKFAEVELPKIVDNDPARRPAAIVAEDLAAVLRRIQEDYVLEAGPGGSLGESATAGANLQRCLLRWRALLRDRGEYSLRDGRRNRVAYGRDTLSVGEPVHCDGSRLHSLEQRDLVNGQAAVSSFLRVEHVSFLRKLPPITADRR